MPIGRHAAVNARPPFPSPPLSDFIVVPESSQKLLHIACLDRVGQLDSDIPEVPRTAVPSSSRRRLSLSSSNPETIPASNSTFIAPALSFFLFLSSHSVSLYLFHTHSLAPLHTLAQDASPQHSRGVRPSRHHGLRR
jgi:hypothetical protein